MLMKGMDTRVVITRGTTNHEEILVESFNFQPMLDVQGRRFLGENLERKEEDYKGGKFSLKGNVEASTYLLLVDDVKERAKRTRTGVVVNINTTLEFRNTAGGVVEKRRVHFPDVRFSDLGTSIGSQEGYVEFNAEGEVSDFVFVEA